MVRPGTSSRDAIVGLAGCVSRPWKLTKGILARNSGGNRWAGRAEGKRPEADVEMFWPNGELFGVKAATSKADESSIRGAPAPVFCLLGSTGHFAVDTFRATLNFKVGSTLPRYPVDLLPHERASFHKTSKVELKHGMDL